MYAVLDRLKAGQRYWPAGFALRALGLAALAGCHRTALLLHRLVTSPPPHQATFGEFAIALATFLLLVSGLALTIEGPGLFREVPIPSAGATF